MRNLIRLSEYSRNDVENIFHIADELQRGKYKDFFKYKTIVMFFPDSSIRTRVTFEKGIYLLGGQTILFPPKALDKKEKIEDVVGYLNNWTDGLIIRHRDISVIDDFREYQVTLELMKSANKNAILNPCPPFYRGEEVSADVIDSDYFVGYCFKKYLLEVQQAIMIYSVLN